MKFDVQKAIEILKAKLEGWLESSTAMLPNIVIAVVVMVFFYFVAKLVRSISGKIISKFSDSKSINNLFTTFSYLFVLGVGLIISFNLLHLQQTVSSLLAGAGILGLALGFAFQDISANFISGVLIAFRKPIQVGDIIKTDEFMGKVEKINLRVTIIRTFQGLHVIIPNKDVFQSPVTNYTRSNERRIDLNLGVSYADDLKKVKEVALNATSNLPFLLEDKEVSLVFTEFGDSSINGKLMLWVNYPNEHGFLESVSDVIIAIKKAFDENDITIPFPIRTLDFGIKGGKDLSEMNNELKATG